ncbi:MAG TPA: SPFH domain-containing protein [Syntrophorhabdaceae bacterium]|jgi:membrane protease subunit (stomatin/prohibitin family)|nr:SPFH domain-containing protein [Syntrophorhabdaceae bacterium]HQM76118.1 SPFH domain-containing protein [Syntrophorhabdaceae bacterium]
MGTDNVVFLEVLEWFDETGKVIVHRIPEGGSGEIKYGAQLIVRENQAAIFFYQGRALDAFGTGRHTLTTANIPILTKILSIPWGMKSPLRAEVYFVSMKTFTNFKWGTRDPVAFRDDELGLIRLRAFGVFNVRVLQPVLFINTLVGTQGIYKTEEIEEYLSNVIVSRLNDFLGENLDTIFNLPGRYESISEGLVKQLHDDFTHYGLGLANLYINSITPPQDVQKAIDDKSRLSVFDDLNKLMQMKAAMSFEKASEIQGEAGAGLGMGMGFMMPAMFGDALKTRQTQKEVIWNAMCPDCEQRVPDDARFCPYCGHQMLVFLQCSKCGKNIPPNARFCPVCGSPTSEMPEHVNCPACGAKNLPKSVYCNQCGGKIA